MITDGNILVVTSGLTEFGLHNHVLIVPEGVDVSAQYRLWQTHDDDEMSFAEWLKNYADVRAVHPLEGCVIDQESGAIQSL